MQRPSANPDSMLPSDFLCDFCERPWDGESPIVEGHRGSLICGDCLAAAYRLVLLDKQSSAPAGYTCTLCLETRPDPGWASPSNTTAACKRCINQSAAILAKNKDYDWKKPVGPA